jgi:hypothetical protein
MTIDSTNFFSNSLVGVPQVAGEVDVYEVHTAPKFATGTKFERQDGAVFRYVHFGAAITSVGAMVGPNLSGTNVLPVAPSMVVAPSSTYQQEADPKGVYPSGRGSKFVLATTGGGNTAVAADDYAGAYINMSVGAGAGYTYRIKGNTAVGTPAAGYYLIELYDRIQSASLTTATVFGIAGCKYSDLMLAAANTGAGVPAGATMATSSATAAWGWIQTKGIAGVKMDGLNVLAAGIGLLGPGRVAILSTGGAVCGWSSISTSLAAIAGVVVAVNSGGNTGLLALNLE